MFLAQRPPTHSWLWAGRLLWRAEHTASRVHLQDRSALQHQSQAQAQVYLQGTSEALCPRLYPNTAAFHP